MLVVAAALPVAAAEEKPARFFSAMQDIPLLDGMTELADQGAIFDKPEGRIVESVAEIESGTLEDARAQYAQTLPQMGWKKTAPGNYVRGEENLVLSFEAYQGKKFARVLLRPLE